MYYISILLFLIRRLQPRATLTTTLFPYTTLFRSLGRDREVTEEARPGDIVGIPNHGTLRVGDTLSERSGIIFTGLPDFAPEILRRVRLDDPMKIKQMRKALLDLAEEGIARVFRPLVGSNWVVGVVRSEEHTSELQSLMRISYAVFCLKKKKRQHNTRHN